MAELMHRGTSELALVLRRLIYSVAIAALSANVSFAQSHAGSPPAESTSPSGQEPGSKKLKRLMLGIDLKETVPLGVGTANRTGIGFMWRWRSRQRRTDDHYKFAYRFGSYSSPISEPMQGQQVAVGDVRIRPLLAGVDYTMSRGKWTWAAGAQAGWAINSLHSPDPVKQRLAAAMGVGGVETHIADTFAFSPRVKGWYEVNRRVSLAVESFYSYARPELTIRTGSSVLTRRLNADALVFKTGVVYGVW